MPPNRSVTGSLGGDEDAEQIIRGGTLRLFVTEDGFYDLTLENLLNGIKQWMEKTRTFTATGEGTIDAWAIDDYNCNLIIQYAVFNGTPY